MNEDKLPDYGHRYYKTQTFNRKRQIIEEVLEQMHELQLQMIDEAVNRSDMQQAKAVIKSIMEIGS